MKKSREIEIVRSKQTNKNTIGEQREKQCGVQDIPLVWLSLLNLKVSAVNVFR